MKKQRLFSFLQGKVLVMVFITSLFCFACKTHQNKQQLTYLSHIEPNADILIGPEACVLKKFQGTSINTVFYINWVFVSNTKNFIFQLEKSFDGKNYIPYIVREGVCSPAANIPLLICIKDTMPKGEFIYFRLKAIPQNYNISTEEIKQYNSLLNASIIMLKRNERAKEFSLLSN